jgi:hypothetical protein
MTIESFLKRLSQASTPEARSWIVTGSLLDTLSSELQSIVWAAAIPHWFDAEILAALRPDLADRATEFYTELQSLSFVETFDDRGHNIHDLTRKVLLDQLWQRDQSEFKSLSCKASKYFAAQPKMPAMLIEEVYHNIAYDTKSGAESLYFIASILRKEYCCPELELLIKVVREQINASRAGIEIEDAVIFAELSLKVSKEQINIDKETIEIENKDAFAPGKLGIPAPAIWYPRENQMQQINRNAAISSGSASSIATHNVSTTSINPESSAVQSYLNILQAIITRMGTNSHNCRICSIASILSILLIDKGSVNFTCISLIPVLFFGFLDAYYHGQERAFRETYNDFVKRMHSGEATTRDLFNVHPRRGFDVVQYTFRSISSFPIYPFYLGLLGMILLTYSLIR